MTAEYIAEKVTH